MDVSTPPDALDRGADDPGRWLTAGRAQAVLRQAGARLKQFQPASPRPENQRE